MDILVLDYIEERHPEVTKEDAACAWAGAVAWMPDLEADEPGRYISGLDLIQKAVKSKSSRFEKTSKRGL